jgi:carbohydrate kinase (thermoresistant glucokinase family)
MRLQKDPLVLFVMGVSGSGKSTIAQLLSAELGLDFVEGDDYHPTSNIEKMSRGTPLTDLDRWPWLEALNQVAVRYQNKGCVMTCSALKKRYRQVLGQGIAIKTHWLYLKGDYDLIYERMQKREHFMDAMMLRSQFDALEEPEEAIVVDISESSELIVQKIKKEIL